MLLHRSPLQDFRKRYHRLYYHFRPDRYYWILLIVGRKAGIAFTALMFNKNAAFQLSVALLVMFIAYALQVCPHPASPPLRTLYTSTRLQHGLRHH